jgi:hypothetical protein
MGLRDSVVGALGAGVAGAGGGTDLPGPLRGR